MDINNKQKREENKESMPQKSQDDKMGDIRGFFTKAPIIIFDTNFWLDIYRNLPDNILTILDVLEHKLFKSIIYIPWMVKVEFEKNYRKIQNEHNKIHLNSINKLKTIAQQYSIKLQKAMTNIQERYKIQNSDAQRENIVKILNDLENQVGQFVEYDEIQEELLQDNVSDKIKEVFDEFAKKLIINNLSKDEVMQCIQEGESRFKQKTPPGYMDEPKERKNKFIFGDVLIWFEILKFAKIHKKDILFVTNDTKEDWFENGAFHSKLVNEFKKETNLDIMGITGKDFYDFVESLNIVQGRLLGGIDTYIENHITEVIDYNEDKFYSMISESIMDENSPIYDECYLTGYDGEYFDCDGDLDYDVEDYEWERVENNVLITVTFNISYKVTTASYIGRDDETKEVYISPYRTHSVVGKVDLQFTKQATEFYSDLFCIDDLSLLQSRCYEDDYEDDYDDYYDDDEGENYCPDCGCVMTDENYGGNGFCSKCAPNH